MHYKVGSEAEECSVLSWLTTLNIGALFSDCSGLLPETFDKSNSLLVLLRRRKLNERFRLRGWRRKRFSLRWSVAILWYGRFWSSDMLRRIDFRVLNWCAPFGELWLPCGSWRSSECNVLGLKETRVGRRAGLTRLTKNLQIFCKIIAMLRDESKWTGTVCSFVSSIQLEFLILYAKFYWRKNP